MITTLDEARTLIQRHSIQLDPSSRYVKELMETVDNASDVHDLETRLTRGCRGRFWAGGPTFDAMSLEDKLLVNLITNETSLMRFEAAEFAHLTQEVVPLLRQTPGRILSLPCSHGEEPVSLAIACVEADYTDFTIEGRDVQSACIVTARSGRIPLSGLPRWVLGLVDPLIMGHLRFEVADVFVADLGGPYDFIVCRNFLGYFRPGVVSAILDKLLSCLATPGVLLLDNFITGKHPEIIRALPLIQAGKLSYFRR